MHQQNNGQQLVVDIGEIIEYESHNDGETYEGEVLEISTERNQVKVMRLDDDRIIQIIEWVSVSNIFLENYEDAIN